MPVRKLTSHLSDRVRIAVDRSRERRDHDRAMSDPRVREEHFAARARDVSAGGSDCHFCR